MYEVELYHHGVKGQKWGVRHFQNKDGSYKPGAEGRYDGSDVPRRTLSIKNSLKSAKAGLSVRKKNHDLSSQNKKLAAQNKKLSDKNEEAKEGKKFKLSDRQKKALKVGAAIAGTALAAYGAKKLYDHVDASHKGKLLAKKLLEDAGGDFGKATEAYNKRLNQYYWDKNTGALGKYGYKSGKIMESTRKSLAESVRKSTFENSQINKDMQAIKAASRARRKEQIDKVTKGLRVGSEKIVSKTKAGSDVVRSRSGDIATRVRSKAGEAAKNAKSAYEHNAGKRMANAINRDYTRRQAMGKAKDLARNTASRVAGAAKSRASKAQEYVYNKSMERTRNKYAERIAKDLRRRRNS